MKFFLTFLCAFFLTTPINNKVSTVQDPEHRRVLIENTSNCNWLVEGLKGKIKIKAPDTGNVSFSAYHPYLQGNVIFLGYTIYKNVFQWNRDYLIMRNSAVIFDHSHLPLIAPWPWWFVIHYNEKSGHGYPNAGAKILVKGPATITLYDGEADVFIGDAEPIHVIVKENDYANYPPWQIKV
jgi:hypothetical protein